MNILEMLQDGKVTLPPDSWTMPYQKSQGNTALSVERVISQRAFPGICGFKTLVRELQGRLRDPAKNLAANLIEWQNLFRQSRAGHKARHSPDHAAGLVLNDDRGAGRAQRFASF